MPDWKRLIVGDAFALQSRNPNFYRDLFLLVPFLISTILAVTCLFSSAHEYRVAMKCALMSVIALSLARERFVLIGGSMGFVCVQSLVSFALKHDLSALVISSVSGGAFLLVIRLLKDYKPSYSVAKGTTISTVLVLFASGTFTFAVLHYWLRP